MKSRTLHFPHVAVSISYLQSAEHVSKFCNLQADFKKATEHLQNWHAAPEQATSSHVPKQRKIPPPSMSTNVRPVFDMSTISKNGCTFVDRVSIVFSVWERDSKWFALVQRDNFARV